MTRHSSYYVRMYVLHTHPLEGTVVCTHADIPMYLRVPSNSQ